MIHRRCYCWFERLDEFMHDLVCCKRAIHSTKPYNEMECSVFSFAVCFVISGRIRKKKQEIQIILLRYRLTFFRFWIAANSDKIFSLLFSYVVSLLAIADYFNVLGRICNFYCDYLFNFTSDEQIEKKQNKNTKRKREYDFIHTSVDPIVLLLLFAVRANAVPFGEWSSLCFFFILLECVGQIAYKTLSSLCGLNTFEYKNVATAAQVHTQVLVVGRGRTEWFADLMRYENVSIFTAHGVYIGKILQFVCSWIICFGPSAMVFVFVSQKCMLVSGDFVCSSCRQIELRLELSHLFTFSDQLQIHVMDKELFIYFLSSVQIFSRDVIWHRTKNCANNCQHGIESRHQWHLAMESRHASVHVLRKYFRIRAIANKISTNKNGIDFRTKSISQKEKKIDFSILKFENNSKSSAGIGSKRLNFIATHSLETLVNGTW